MPAFRQHLFLLLTTVVLCQAGIATADEPREYVDDKGNKVREYRDVVKRQVWDTQYTEQQQTILKPEIKTEYQTQVRQYQVPITETVLVPELVNRWNPFATPHYEYKQVQRTRYELKQETVQIPITRQHWVQSQDTVKVPKLVAREQEEEIIRRVVVRDLPAAATSNTQIAKLPPATAPAARTAAIPTIRANPSAPPATLPAATAPAPAVVQRDPFAAPAPSTNFHQPTPAPTLPNNNVSIARRATSTTIPPPATAPSAMLPPAGMPSGYANPPATLPTNPAPASSMYNMPAGAPNTATPAPTVPGRYQ